MTHTTIASGKDEMSQYQVVWSGRDSLIPDRAERWDRRFHSMPTVDEEAEVVVIKPKRKYNKTGNHVGRFSRTDPSAMQFKPTKKGDNSGHE